jgi:dUTP pyrophosphatase
MRIQGYFGRHGAPYVDAKLGRGDGREPIDVSFLIDTGAYGTLISLQEIHRLGVSVHELRQSIGKAVGFGGLTQFYHLENVEITFTTDQGPRTEALPRVLTSIGPATGPHRKRPKIQSLLGRDILDRFAVSVSKRANLVLLSAGDRETAAEAEVLTTFPADPALPTVAATRPLRVLVTPAPEAEGLPLPEYATAGSVGMDLRAAISEPVTLAPGERAGISTGIRIAVPPGYEAQVRPRSGLAIRHGISMVNAPGTIDVDFRGICQVILINHGAEPFTIHRGDRIGQLVVAPVYRVEWEVVEELPETARGEGGFGHTGQ